MTGIIALLLWWKLDKVLFGKAVAGLISAWAASTVSVTALAVAKRDSEKAFWWAFGGGIALRVGVLVVLVAWALNDRWQVQASSWCSYVLCVLILLQLEYRHLFKE